MIARVLHAEVLKIRRKMIVLLIVLGPLGVVGLQGVNFGLRYDYLVEELANDLWGGLIGNIAMLAVPTLFAGLAIIASMTAGIEHQTNAWKMTLALPVTRTGVFAGKFIMNALLLLGSCTLLAAGTVVLGVSLGFGLSEAPIGRLLEVAYLPLLAIMPFLALQVWLSVTMTNQAIPLTAGIAGTVVSLFYVVFDDWVPYKWPHLANAADNPLYSAAAGVALGSVILGAALVHFARKDVK